MASWMCSALRTAISTRPTSLSSTFHGGRTRLEFVLLIVSGSKRFTATVSDSSPRRMTSIQRDFSPAMRCEFTDS